MKINIIEMQYEDGHMDESMYPDIEFFKGITMSEMIHKANNIYVEGLGYDEQSSTDMIRTWCSEDNSLDELVKQLQDDYIDEEDLENFETIEDFMYEDEDYFLEEIFGSDMELITDFFKANELVFSTVGYSPWSYVLYAKDLKHSYVNDVYEGWNFYSIATLDVQGVVVDSIGFVYLDEDYTVADAVKDNFGIEDFFLVNNDASRFIDHKKINKIANVEYSFEVI